MRFTADRGPLLEAVARVQSAAGNGKSIPILGTVLLRAEGDRLIVRATDNVLEARVEAAAQVDQPGEICVPLDQLRDLLRSLPDGAELGAKIEPGDPRLAVVAGRARFKVPTLPASDFPKLPPDGDKAVRGLLAAKDLARLLDKTLFAISADQTRYHLAGVHLHTMQSDDGPRLRAVATDGAKLAYAEGDCPEDLRLLEPITVPGRLAAEVRRWLGDLACDVELIGGDGRLSLQVGTGCLRGQLIDSPFPDYRRVIPADQPHHVQADRALFMGAVRRVMVAAQATEKTKLRVVRVTASAGTLAFSSRSADRGEAAEELEAGYDGPEISIAFNATHLLEIADRLGGGHIDLGFTDHLGAVSIREPGDAGLLMLTMPVRA